MADDRDERTELPTDRRREETRGQGNIARSMDLNAAFLAVASTGTLYFFGGDLSRGLLDILHASLSGEAWVRLDEGQITAHSWKLAGALATGLVPLLAVLVLAAIASGVLQAGFHLTPEAIQPNWGRLNPLSGVGRVFSLQGAMRVVASLFKMLILGLVVLSFLSSELPKLMATASLDLGPIARLSSESLLTLSFQLALSLVILAGLDYGYQFWQFEQNLKMTKQELRDELRMMEGDPQLKHRRREIHRKLADSRQMQRAKDATVMITNPTHITVALKYVPDKLDAPLVVAKGMGPLAQRLREIAAERGIPIVEKKPLARALYQVKVGHAVPVELYAAVAEIIAYVMRLSGKKA